MKPTFVYTLIIVISYISYLEIISAQPASSRLLETFAFNGPEQSAIVDAHNKARRTVSPTAQNMKKMTWDNELAEVASQYSRQCLFEHSDNPVHSRFQPLGENIFVSTRIPFNPSYATQSVTSWDDEKSDYNFRTVTCDPGKVCGHYTQVVWADTFKVGCGASKCSTINVFGNQWRDATVLICNYGPAGNFRGRTPYDQGRPCSGCHPSDRCENSLCTNPNRDSSAPISSLMPTWSQWSQWTPCSTTCGIGGTRRRTRMCNTTVNADCSGQPTGTEFFCSFSTPCSSSGGGTTNPTWGRWGSWSSCSRSCGGGERIARRRCSTGNNRDCTSGRNTKTSRCNLDSCQTATWSAWGNWGRCSQSCGGGERTARRRCSTGNNRDCSPGRNIRTSQCNRNACPTWGAWGTWGSCSISCGGGERTTRRACSTGNNRDCTTGRNVKTSRCNRNACPTWSEWANWSSCSLSCGGGERLRTRGCSSGNGNECAGPSRETASCSTSACPGWGAWETWGSCSQSCGGGEQTASRRCTTGNNRDCSPGRNIRTSQCNRNACPTWDEWINWSSCSSSCGGGERFRTRVCSSAVANQCLGPSRDTTPCVRTSACPTWGAWGTWGSCSLSCGGGERTRRRACSTGNNRDCTTGRNVKTSLCNRNACPTWSEWANWSSCSLSCGGGERLRTRGCSSGNGNECAGPSRETASCSTSACPVFGPWTNWGQCSVTCDGGTRRRTRVCGSQISSDCGGSLETLKTCNTNLCPAGSSWESWLTWSSCSLTCGNGIRSRTRRCLNFPCTGQGNSSESCNTQNCPAWKNWNTWSSCSLSCGGGQRFRTRVCSTGNSQECEGRRNQSVSCSTSQCPVIHTTETTTLEGDEGVEVAFGSTGAHIRNYSLWMFPLISLLMLFIN